jgi:acetate kinase
VCRLMMGTRCGDIDPSVVIYLAQHCGMAVADIDKLMNKQACGTSGWSMVPISHVESTRCMQVGALHDTSATGVEVADMK